MPTPEKLNRIIEAVRQHNSPLPYENDVTRANEKIFELWTALNNMMLLYQNKDNQHRPGQYADEAKEVLASAQKMEVESCGNL